MRYEKLTTEELYELRSKMVRQNKDTSEINFLIDCRESEYYFSLMEDTSATGGPAGSVGAMTGGGGVAFGDASTQGMGPVLSPHASRFAGVTTEPNYSNGGGFTGNDIGVSYNTGPKGVFQKVRVDNRKGTNKRRKNKMLAGLMSRQDFTAGQGKAKTTKSSVMDFDSFSAKELNKVTKVNQ